MCSVPGEPEQEGSALSIFNFYFERASDLLQQCFHNGAAIAPVAGSVVIVEEIIDGGLAEPFTSICNGDLQLTI